MSSPRSGKFTGDAIFELYDRSCRKRFKWTHSISGNSSTREYFIPFRSFLHFSQLTNKFVFISIPIICWTWLTYTYCRPSIRLRWRTQPYSRAKIPLVPRRTIEPSSRTTKSSCLAPLGRPSTFGLNCKIFTKYLIIVVIPSPNFH